MLQTTLRQDPSMVRKKNILNSFIACLMIVVGVFLFGLVLTQAIRIDFLSNRSDGQNQSLCNVTQLTNIRLFSAWIYCAHLCMKITFQFVWILPMNSYPIFVFTARRILKLNEIFIKKLFRNLNEHYQAPLLMRNLHSIVSFLKRKTNSEIYSIVSCCYGKSNMWRDVNSSLPFLDIQKSIESHYNWCTWLPSHVALNRFLPQFSKSAFSSSRTLFGKCVHLLDRICLKRETRWKGKQCTLLFKIKFVHC